MKKTLKIVYVIIGTLIGAGFASGQEIYQFFYQYGKQGIVGLAISTAIICLVIGKVLKIVKEKQIKNYKQLLDELLKTTSKKYLNLKTIINNIINIFILMTYFIMIAGFGAYFEQQWKIPHLIGSSLLAIICYIVLQKNIEGVIKVNEKIIPLLITFITIIGILTMKTSIQNLQQIQTQKTHWLISSALYAGYNSILLIPVLITLREYLDNKKQIIQISSITAIITIVLGIIIFMILTNIGQEIANIQMPVAAVISAMPAVITLIYGIIIVSSIFTTSVALGNSYLNNATKNKKAISIAINIIAVLTSNLGFSNLITYVYPLFRNTWISTNN